MHGLSNTRVKFTCHVTCIGNGGGGGGEEIRSLFFKLFTALDMKGCICHLTKWQIHPFISKGRVMDIVLSQLTRDIKSMLV